LFEAITQAKLRKQLKREADEDEEERKEKEGALLRTGTGGRELTNFEATTVVSFTTGGGKRGPPSARGAAPTSVAPMNGAPNVQNPAQ
jgi:hypothetical protein